MLLTATKLDQLLAALASGDAAVAIEDAREASYPVITDSDGVARIAEDN